MAQIKIEKDIFVRDQYNVKRRVWVAGQVVESYIYHAVLKTNTAVNPEDLPIEPKAIATSSLHSKAMETKQLEDSVPTLAEEAPKQTTKKKGKN